LNIKEASEYLQIPKATLYGYTCKGVLPYYKPQERRVYFKVEDLNNFILNHFLVSLKSYLNYKTRIL